MKRKINVHSDRRSINSTLVHISHHTQHTHVTDHIDYMRKSSTVSPHKNTGRKDKRVKKGKIQQQQLSTWGNVKREKWMNEWEKNPFKKRATLFSCTNRVDYTTRKHHSCAKVKLFLSFPHFFFSHDFLPFSLPKAKAKSLLWPTTSTTFRSERRNDHPRIGRIIRKRRRRQQCNINEGREGEATGTMSRASSREKEKREKFFKHFLFCHPKTFPSIKIKEQFFCKTKVFRLSTCKNRREKNSKENYRACQSAPDRFSTFLTFELHFETFSSALWEIGSVKEE